MPQCEDPCLEIFNVAPRFSLITYSYSLTEWLRSVFSHCMDAETLSNGLGVWCISVGAADSYMRARPSLSTFFPRLMFLQGLLTWCRAREWLSRIFEINDLVCCWTPLLQLYLKVLKCRWKHLDVFIGTTELPSLSIIYYIIISYRSCGWKCEDDCTLQ